MYQLCLQHLEVKGQGGMENFEKIYHQMCIFRIRAKIEELQVCLTVNF